MIAETDRLFIENKYHKTDEPFDPYHRMRYHGYEYDPRTGLDDAEMNAGLAALMPTLAGLPHPVAKAHAFAYVLDHARIDVNEHDWFIGFYNWGRPLAAHTQKVWDREVFAALPGVREEIKTLDTLGVAAIWPDYDHVIPDWNALLSLGFGGLLDRVKTYHESHREKGISPETEAFFAGIEISFEAILRLLDRYCRYAAGQRHAKAERQLLCLTHLRGGAPRDLYEALTAMYLYFILCECVDQYQTRSIGNGIDATLLPFYRADRAAGVSDEWEREVLSYFLMQFSAIGNYWGHPMYLGGTDARGEPLYNEVSDLILDLYGEMRLSNPKIQIKVNRNTPRAVLDRVFSLIRDGVTPFVFCCEPGYRRAMRGYGVTEEEARTFEIAGCYESRVRGDESCTAGGYVNAAKAVELALHDGADVKTGTQVGPHTGAASSFADFETFYNAFLTQWGAMIERVIRIVDSFEEALAVVNPANLYSATVTRALERGVDGYSFGVKYPNTHLLNCGFATAVDAMMAVKKLCFDEKAVSLSALTATLDRNWEGAAPLRAKVLALPQKYGNAEPETDRLAAAMANFFAGRISGRPNARGGVYKVNMHTAMMFVWQGAKTAATPDGRRAGDEIAKNGSPTSGADRRGVTALIRSALALSPWQYGESFCLDVMLHPSAVAGQDGLDAMYGLVMTYLEHDGLAIQFNIFNADTLRDAQRHPEHYRSLQVRVCGWNTLWNDLSEAEQNAFIRQAEKEE